MTVSEICQYVTDNNSNLLEENGPNQLAEDEIQDVPPADAQLQEAL